MGPTPEKSNVGLHIALGGAARKKKVDVSGCRGLRVENSRKRKFKSSSRAGTLTLYGTRSTVGTGGTRVLVPFASRLLITSISV